MPIQADIPLRLRNMKPKYFYGRRGTGTSGRPFKNCSPEMAATFRILHADGKGLRIAEIARRYNVDAHTVTWHVHHGKDYTVPSWLARIQEGIKAALSGDLSTASAKLSSASQSVTQPQIPDEDGQLYLL